MKDTEPVIPERSASDTKLDLLKHLTEVQSQIKKRISTDFTLAHLSEKDIEAITEMTSNAYFSNRILDTIMRQSIMNGKDKWNSKTKQWEKVTITKEDLELMEQTKQAVFDSYMTRLYMTAILSRNKKTNHMLNVIASSISGVIHETKPEPDEELEGMTTFQKVKTKLMQKDKPKVEE